jgi:hypothetical protein
MADIEKMIKRGWAVKSLTSVLTRTIQDDGETLERTKTLVVDEEDLQELAGSDAKNDKKTIRELRQDLKDLRDKRKEAKDKLAKLKK